MNAKKTLVATIGACVMVYPLFKSSLLPLPVKPMDGTLRTAVVTGATGNLGRAITYHLAVKNCRVIMACRDLEKCKLIRRELVLLTKSKNIVCRHLDLEDVESINNFANEISASEPHIDIIINNAAIKHSPKKEMTKYGIEKMYFVNFLAPFLLTFKLIDKLNESARLTKDSRVINVIGTPNKSWNLNLDDINFEKTSYDSKKAYNQSKLALAYFTILLEQYNKGKRDYIYVYGTSPCFKKIMPSLEYFKGLRMGPRAVWNAYFHASPNQACGSVIKLSLDPDCADRDHSGRLYTYALSSFGWKGIDKNESEARLVWNHAAQTLLNLKEPPKESK